MYLVAASAVIGRSERRRGARSMVTKKKPGCYLTSLAAAAVLVAGSVAGCSSQSGQSAAEQTTPAGAPAKGGLAQLYKQQLKWHSCAEGECANLQVPLDYAKPTGPTVNIAVNRVKATGDRKGALVVNPGGPGGSGVDYAAAADQIVTGDVHSKFDIVGFDPRGVQRSAAITCVSDAQLDDILGDDPDPTTPKEEQTLLGDNQKFAQSCAKNAGPLLGHVSTEDVAKDMDILRAALGEKKLNYLGKSYGTLIGATYADLFAKNVGRMVLDGVLPPDLSMKDINLGQARGFERALDAYVADCVAQGNCPLGTDEKAAKKKLKTWLESLKTTTVAVHGDARMNRLEEGWAVNGLAEGLYDQGSWANLTSALRSAMAGDGTALFKAGARYANRNSDGTYSGNIMQAINAVTCLDRPVSTTSAEGYRKEAAEFTKQAPTWGAQLAWASSSCAKWPIKATGKPHTVSADASGAILVVGTTRDPATPYEWSERLAKQLKHGRLLSFDGDGHTAYARGSACVDDVVNAYLVDGKDPGKKTSC